MSQLEIDQSLICHCCGDESTRANYTCDTCRDHDLGTINVGVFTDVRADKARRSTIAAFTLLGINHYQEDKVLDIYGYDALTGVEVSIRVSTKRPISEGDLTHK